MNPLRILLVEDDPGMALLVSERLEDGEGWSVRRAETAAESRRALGEQSFEVVLLDRGLPDCDGASMIRELTTEYPEMAVVMLTGADSAESATETLKLGAWDYVVKRSDLGYLDELPAVIRRCAERMEWRREEARLHAEMDLLQTAIRSAADAVIMIGADGIVRFWNEAAEQLFGWSAEDVLGSPIPIIPPERQDEMNDLGARARAGNPLVGVEMQLCRRNGSMLEVSLTLTAVRNPDGSLRAYVGVMRDIAERRRLERDRRDLIAMLTHDIKNPLTAIRGWAFVLSEADLSPEHRECVEAIEHSADTINRLVSDFLTSATIEAGTFKLNLQQVALGPLLRECVLSFRPAAAHAEVELVQAGDIGDVEVRGEAMQLERVIGNLIGNALKFTPPGGTVTVESLCRDDSVIIRVSDTGPGIGPELLPYVFDKYRRAKGAQHVEGAGLGLFIVRHLVEAHGGSVSVSSELDRGSTFEVRLPIDRVATGVA